MCLVLFFVSALSAFSRMSPSSRRPKTSDMPNDKKIRFILDSETDQTTVLAIICALSLTVLTFFLMTAQIFSCRHQPLTVEHAVDPSSEDPGEASSSSGYLVDINTASVPELCILPGIGEITARKIVAERDANGPFRSADDLRRVRGIGYKKVEALESMIAPIEGDSLPDAPQTTAPLTEPSL